MTATTIRVGFVGIGNMGWPMARNILAAGFTLHVYDADPARTARFALECGGSGASSIEALGRESDLVITMLPTGHDVRAALLGPGDADGKGHGGASGAHRDATGTHEDAGKRGLASSLQPGAIVVDMSSSDPVGTRELGTMLRERGIALIDAPVSGLVPRAESGTLTIMIGADDEDALMAAEPVLKCLGEQLVRIGSLGCGHAMKALNNFVAATAFTATAEALIVGKRFGLDPQVMTEVLNVSTGRSFHSAVSFPDQVLTRRFASGFTLGLLAKDVGIAGDLGHAIGTQTPLIELVQRLWAEGRDEVGPAEDNAAIIKRWERLNDVVVEPARKEKAAPG